MDFAFHHGRTSRCRPSELQRQIAPQGQPTRLSLQGRPFQPTCRRRLRAAQPAGSGKDEAHPRSESNHPVMTARAHEYDNCCARTIAKVLRSVA
jgi:hypothetical protein